MISCIPRAEMPQVDEADIGGLIAFLSARGVASVMLTVTPTSLVSRQHIVPGKVRSILRAEAALLAKPLLVAFDRVVVDGNHRYAAARIRGVGIPVVLFNRAFADLLGEVFAYPKTYTYGASPQPIRN